MEYRVHKEKFISYELWYDEDEAHVGSIMKTWREFVKERLQENMFKEEALEEPSWRKQKILGSR